MSSKRTMETVGKIWVAILATAIILVFLFGFVHAIDTAHEYKTVQIDCKPQSAWVVRNDGKERHQVFECTQISGMVTK